MQRARFHPFVMVIMFGLSHKVVAHELSSVETAPLRWFSDVHVTERTLQFSAPELSFNVLKWM